MPKRYINSFKLIEYSKQKQRTSKCKRQINSTEFAFIVFQNAFYGIKKVLCEMFMYKFFYFEVTGFRGGENEVKSGKPSKTFRSLAMKIPKL